MEDEEAGTEGPGWAATGAAVIRRGWWIGKRAAIAGAAITCVPIVIPPLVVLSILGVAFSFPSGIYLAGYACTDRFMSALLPLPTVKEEGEETMESNEGAIQRGLDTDCEDKLALKEGIEGCSLIVIPGKQESASAASENNGSPKIPYGVVVMAPDEESKRGKEPSNLSQEHLSIVEARGEEKSKGILEEMQPIGLPEVCRSEVEPPSLMSDSLLSKKEASDTSGEVEIMEHNTVAKPGINAVIGGVGLSGVHTDDERIYDEEQLWEQIMAMRTIVGYKIPMKASFGEELRALFLFIGVEPPLSLKDMFELVESLQFLKSIVGVETRPERSIT